MARFYFGVGFWCPALSSSEEHTPPRRFMAFSISKLWIFQKHDLEIFHKPFRYIFIRRKGTIDL